MSSGGLYAAVLGNLEDLVSLKNAPVAQLDRANASGALGREFESLRAHHPIHFNSRRVSFEERLSVLDAGAFAQGSNARKNRTYNLSVKSRMLCQLSYASKGVRKKRA